MTFLGARAASSAYSARLAANTSYTWNVFSLGPCASLDDFAGSSWAGGYPSPGDGQDVVTTGSESMSFKTAP